MRLSRETKKREMADLKVQEKLRLSKGKNPMLKNLTIRPNLTGRRTIGALEAHINGLRFTSVKGQTVGMHLP